MDLEDVQAAWGVVASVLADVDTVEFLAREAARCDEPSALQVASLAAIARVASRAEELLRALQEDLQRHLAAQDGHS